MLGIGSSGQNRCGMFFWGLLTCLGGSQGSQFYSYREFRPKPDYPIMGSDAFGNGPREPARPCCFPAAGCFFLDF